MTLAATPSSGIFSSLILDGAASPHLRLVHWLRNLLNSQLWPGRFAQVYLVYKLLLSSTEKSFRWTLTIWSPFDWTICYTHVSHCYVSSIGCQWASGCHSSSAKPFMTQGLIICGIVDLQLFLLDSMLWQSRSSPSPFYETLSFCRA